MPPASYREGLTSLLLALPAPYRSGLAMLICCSEEAIETFIAHCDTAAYDLLLPYGDVLIVLSTVLRIKRTLDGAEIDDLISDLQARKALATERARRKRWEGVVENAARLVAD